MRSLVIYSSKTGFTKKYAKWLAEDLSADIIDVTEAKADTLLNYDTVIYGGGLYAIGISGIKYIKQNISKLKNKKVVVFATGLSTSRDDVVRVVKNHNFTAAEQKQLQLFYLRGGFDYSKLSLLYKVIMTFLKWKLMLKSKHKLTTDEQGMLASYAKPVDFTRRENLEKMISYVKE
jgi:menaquinone-dependent protoporphyrinogen IX oxidase